MVTTPHHTTQERQVLFQATLGHPESQIVSVQCEPWLSSKNLQVKAKRSSSLALPWLHSKAKQNKTKQKPKQS